MVLEGGYLQYKCGGKFVNKSDSMMKVENPNMMNLWRKAASNVLVLINFFGTLRSREMLFKYRRMFVKITEENKVYINEDS